MERGTSKLIKYAALTICGLLALLASLLAYIAATFDPNDYKPYLIRVLKDKTQRDLKIEGDIELSLLPTLGATLNFVTLSNRASASEFARAESIRVTLNLLPLLAKEVVVDAIQAKNVRIDLIRFKDGTLNVDDLFEARDQPILPAISLDIGRITLVNAVIGYNDQATGRSYALTNLELTAGRIADRVPSKIDASFSAHSTVPQLDLKTTLKSIATVDFSRQRYRLAGLEVGVQGQVADVSLSAVASGEIDVKRIEQELVVSKLAVEVTTRLQKSEFVGQLRVPALRISGDTISSAIITHTAKLAWAHGGLTARVELKGMEGNLRSLSTNELNASIDMKHNGGVATTKISSRMNGSFEALRIELPGLSANFTANDPKFVKRPIGGQLAGSAIVDFLAHNANLIFAAKVDDSAINGSARVEAFAPPRYRFELNIDQLDADRYWPPAVADAEPPDLTALESLKASGDIKIGTLKIGEVKASNVRLVAEPTERRSTEAQR